MSEWGFEITWLKSMQFASYQKGSFYITSMPQEKCSSLNQSNYGFSLRLLRTAYTVVDNLFLNKHALYC